jgi:hypothetical protein
VEFKVKLTHDPKMLSTTSMLGSGASTASLLERTELLATYRALSQGQLLTALLDNDSK